MTKQSSSLAKRAGIGLSILVGVGLVVGATLNLPANAQGVVTGRNAVLVDQLTEQVGAQALTEAIADAGLVSVSSVNQFGLTDNEQRERTNNRRQGNADRDRRDSHSRRDGRRSERDETRRANGGMQLSDAVEDQLIRLSPELLFDAVVDAGLLTEEQAARMLNQ